MHDRDGRREPPLIALVGPTAVGKTAAGIALAQRVGGEIVSADAVAVYRGLDIGSAKPTDEEKAAVRFHLIDVVDPDVDFTLADYKALADEAIADIRSRGRVPILVGGTGLYVRSVTARLSLPEVPPQPEVRERLTREAEENGTPALHARLAEVDPTAAGKIAVNDRKRIIRALEVYEATGRPLSSFHTPEGIHGIPRANTRLFGLTMERETLYSRIDKRVDAQMRAGFLEEVRGLLDAGYGPDLKSMQSLGYRHLARHLLQDYDLATALEELKRDSRRYAKRQYSWFNADPGIRWIEMAEPEATAAIVGVAALETENIDEPSSGGFQ